MKHSITFILLFSMVVSLYAQHANGVYGYSITEMSGVKQPLTVYQNKKLLIVVLPAGRTTVNTALLDTLNALNQKYGDSLTMIGIPAYEYGYRDDSAASLQQWYAGNLGTAIIVAKGMYTSKSTFRQNLLFSWLTHKDKNLHFDYDTKGAGQTFYINKKGILKGESDSNIMVSDQMIQTYLQQKN